MISRKPRKEMNSLTWYDIKLITLQKMFALNGDRIVEDDTTMPYLSAMPYTCNEGLSLLYADDDKITPVTPDDYEFKLDDKGAELLPLYMASQLYKDEDVGLAAIYRNEFEVGREQYLRSGQSDVGAAKVVRLRG
ncbi:MAG: hypothetical protein FWE04_02475 [Oscillospiraceae bacterium]|nr:hypothetical protein [Oscillospiraceae bacterium]